MCYEALFKVLNDMKKNFKYPSKAYCIYIHIYDRVTSHTAYIYICIRQSHFIYSIYIHIYMTVTLHIAEIVTGNSTLL